MGINDNVWGLPPRPPRPGNTYNLKGQGAARTPFDPRTGKFLGFGDEQAAPARGGSGKDGCELVALEKTGGNDGSDGTPCTFVYTVIQKGRTLGSNINPGAEPHLCRRGPGKYVPATRGMIRRVDSRSFVVTECNEAPAGDAAPRLYRVGAVAADNTATATPWMLHGDTSASPNVTPDPDASHAIQAVVLSFP